MAAAVRDRSEYAAVPLNLIVLPRCLYNTSPFFRSLCLAGEDVVGLDGDDERASMDLGRRRVAN